MDRDQFWKIIAASRRAAAGDLDTQVEALRVRLEKLSPDEIVRFQKIFDEYHGRAYHWDLWAAAYLIGGGCSDDGFMDFRAWLISRGRKVYETALKDPQSLVRVVREEDEDCQFEPFLYVPVEVWASKTGNQIGDFPLKRKLRESPRGKPWAEEGDELQRRFPMLWKKFVGE